MFSLDPKIQSEILSMLPGLIIALGVGIALGLSWNFWEHRRPQQEAEIIRFPVERTRRPRFPRV